jgi:hypothetical protein
MMKKSHLIQIIKEEIQHVLREESNLYTLEGLLKTNTDTKQSGRPQKDILSDIRAIEGITIVSSKDYTLQSDISPIKNPNYYSLITIKIDPDPFKKTGFTEDNLKDIMDKIRQVKGVKGFERKTDVEKTTVT